MRLATNTASATLEAVTATLGHPENTPFHNVAATSVAPMNAGTAIEAGTSDRP